MHGGSVEEQEIANRLFAHRDDASFVNELSRPEAEPPLQPTQCHPNVISYVARHPDCKRRRGWLIGDHGTFLYFNAHSVVEAADGSLGDITLYAPRCPFLSHPGTDEEFDAFTATTSRVTHLLPRDEWPDVSEFNIDASISEEGEDSSDL